MKFKAEIDIMPHEALLDPQGKAVSNAMQNVELPEISDVRLGKHAKLFIDVDSRQEAEEKVTKACQKLLANQIMESFTFTLEEVK